jgi:hypothetical protein
VARRHGPTSHIGASGPVIEQGLVNREPIVVDSGTIMCALLHAGLPSDDYAFGGRHWGKQWHLDVEGTLTKLARYERSSDSAGARRKRRRIKEIGGEVGDVDRMMHGLSVRLLGVQQQRRFV